jgi:hypothetical protein
MVIFTRQSAAIDTTSTNPPPQTQNIFEFIVTVVVNTSVGVESKARVGASRLRRMLDVKSQAHSLDSATWRPSNWLDLACPLGGT